MRVLGVLQGRLSSQPLAEVLSTTVAECHVLIREQAHHIELLLHRHNQLEEKMSLVQEQLKLDSKNSGTSSFRMETHLIHRWR